MLEKTETYHSEWKRVLYSSCVHEIVPNGKGSKLAMNSPGCSSDQVDVVTGAMLTISSCLLGGMTKSMAARHFNGFHESIWRSLADGDTEIRAAMSSVSIAAPVMRSSTFWVHYTLTINTHNCNSVPVHLHVYTVSLPNFRVVGIFPKNSKFSESNYK